MKTNVILFKSAIALACALSVASCKSKEEPTPTPTPAGAKAVTLTADIPAGASRSLSADTVYTLGAQVQVSGTINIAAGTIIKGDKVAKGALVILPGGKINAIGTPTKPIVFTSAMAPGLRNAGDWGGIIIVGKAPVNQTTCEVEGLTRKVSYGLDQIAAADRKADDNSGTLQYVRIEFAGIPLLPDKEINGLTMCAVGSGTTIDHIQVSYSGDDSFEWFGGTVNCKYIIAYLGLDDEFDTDFGYSGNVQFAFGLRSPRIADVSTSNGFESDNDANGSTFVPQTKAVFSNVTCIGPWKSPADANVNKQFGAGMHIRRNSSLSCFNSVFAGWNLGLVIDGSLSLANATAGDLAVQNCCLVGSKMAVASYVNTNSGAISKTKNDTTVLNFFTNGTGNSVIKANQAPKIAANAKDSASIDLCFYDATKVGTAANPVSNLPGVGSPILTGASFTHAKLQNAFFDKTPTYRGAFGTSDWAKESWTNWDPQNTVY
jgi:hypothetical protein